jgi:hypothetical protein
LDKNDIVVDKHCQMRMVKFCLMLIVTRYTVGINKDGFISQKRCFKTGVEFTVDVSLEPIEEVVVTEMK